MKNEEICPIKAFLSYAKPSIFPNAKNLCNFLAIPESCTRSIITEQCNLEISKSSLSCWWKLEISIKGFMRKSWVWAGHLKEIFPLAPIEIFESILPRAIWTIFSSAWMKKEKEGGAILIFQNRFFFSQMKKFSSKIGNFFFLM